MNTMNDKTEKILIKALELFDQGKSPEEILRLFPDGRQELGEMFKTINLLKATKKEILPEKNFVINFINHLNTISLIRNQKNPIGRLIRWQIVAPAAVLAIFVALVLINTSSSPQTTFTSLPDRFELTAIQEEAMAAEFNPELINFLDEESNIQEVDIVLTNL